jgi:hypothetical protein
VARGLERFTDGVEGEGLAGSGPPDDHFDGPAGPAEPLNHVALLVGQRWSSSDGGGHRRRVGSDLDRGGTGGQSDDQALTGQSFGCCPPARVHGDRSVRGEELLGALEDLVEGRALAGCLGHGSDCVASFEGGVFIG